MPNTTSPTARRIHRQRTTWNTTAWRKVRLQVLARDGHQCQACGTTSRLTVHHRYGYETNERFNPATLITLCSSCHGRIDGPKGRGGRSTPMGGVTAAGVSFRACGEVGNRFQDTVFGCGA